MRRTAARRRTLVPTVCTLLAGAGAGAAAAAIGGGMAAIGGGMAAGGGAATMGLGLGGIGGRALTSGWICACSSARWSAGPGGRYASQAQRCESARRVERQVVRQAVSHTYRLASRRSSSRLYSCASGSDLRGFQARGGESECRRLAESESEPLPLRTCSSFGAGPSSDLVSAAEETASSKTDGSVWARVMPAEAARVTPACTDIGRGLGPPSLRSCDTLPIEARFESLAFQDFLSSSSACCCPGKRGSQ